MKKIKDGDIITFGAFAQVWLIEKKKNKLWARIISFDSGRGYEMEIDDIKRGASLKQNNFSFLGNIKGQTKKISK